MTQVDVDALARELDRQQRPVIEPRPDTATLLAQRASTHGEFNDHAAITQSLKTVMHSEASWANLTFAQKESLDMIVHKIGRVLAGNPNHIDHWDDIAGYAMLVSQRIKR